MNESKAIERDDEQLLDLLVDGELSDTDRKQVLSWCERESEGWRRCALAFLEAQSWDKSLRGIAGEPANSATKVHPRAPAWFSRPWISLLAMAASFLLAFVLGLAMRGQRGSVSNNNPGTDLAANQPATQGPDAGNPLERQDGNLAAGPWQNVRLLVGNPQDGPTEEIELPVVEGKTLDESWLQSEPLPVPSAVKRALERMGHRVQTQRKLVPVSLNDGRRLIVPVDQVEVHPVRSVSYQ